MIYFRIEKKYVFYFIIFFTTVLHTILFQIKIHSKASVPFQNNKPITIKFTKRTLLNNQIVRSKETSFRLNKVNSFLSDKTRAFERQTRAKLIGSFSSKGGQSVRLSELGEIEDPFRKAAKKYSKVMKDSIRSRNQEVGRINNYLPTIPLGDLTQLNTLKYKHFGYLFRIRKKLEQFWESSIQQKAQELANDGRHISSSDEFITALRMTLDEEGRVLRIELLRASGVKELDEAAIESLNSAGPFPNPPKELIIDGLVKLEWGFVINT